MAVTKREADGDHPSTHYLVVPDPAKPSTWALRVRDINGKLDHRLMGAAKAALTAPNGFRGNKYDGPQKQQALAKLKRLYQQENMDFARSEEEAPIIMIEADFSGAEVIEDEEDIILRGRLFKAGNYPERDFTMTPEELADAILAFIQPVPMDLAHVPALVAIAQETGIFGQITEIWEDETGEWMMAEARKPKWLHEKMPETRVSASFARDTKRLRGAAWTSMPVVKDAELIAAFANSRHNTSTGQAMLQRLHNAAVSAGAVCAKGNTAGMASRHEASAIQQIHDIATEHGADCETGDGSPQYGFFGGRAEAALGKIEALLSRLPVPSGPEVKPDARSTTMGWTEWLLGKAKEEGLSEEEQKQMEAAFAGTEVPQAVKDAIAAKDQEIAALKAAQEATAQFAERIEAERRHRDAETFAQTLVTAKRLTPAAAEKLVPLVERIKAADATATFAEGEKRTEELLTEFAASLVDLSVFTTEAIAPKEALALFNQEETEGASGKDKEPSQERLHALLKLYPGGDKLVAQLNGQK